MDYMTKKIMGLDVNIFMNSLLWKGTSVSQIESSLKSHLKGYNIDNLAIMPDFTPSNSLPIGTTMKVDDNMPLNPSWIGMDIGCGYRLFSIDLKKKKLEKNRKLNTSRIQKIVDAIDTVIHKRRNISPIERARQFFDGSNALINKYFDSSFNPDITSESKQSIANNFGSIGNGNHFIDLFIPDVIKNQQHFKNLGLDPDKVYILIHTGSRELGYKINQEFTSRFQSNTNTQEFNYSYLNAVQTALAYAQANRAFLQDEIAESLNLEGTLHLDLPHNAIELVGGGKNKQYLVRKGADFLTEGSLGIIPTTFAGDAHLVIGLPNTEKTNYSKNHGLGRMYTRQQMFGKYGRINKSKLNKLFPKGIISNVSPQELVEELPNGYKSPQRVIESFEDTKMGYVLATLKPLAVIVERKRNGK